MSYDASDAADGLREILVRQGVEFVQGDDGEDERFRIGGVEFEGPDNGGNATVVEALDRYMQRVDTLLKQASRAISGMENVPVVGDVYDQQHADTHMRAMLELRNALKALGG